MPMLGQLLKLLNQWVPPLYLCWLLLGINLHQLYLEQHLGIGMVAMTGKGIGSGSGEMELRKGMPLPIVLRATLKLLALNL